MRDAKATGRGNAGAPEYREVTGSVSLSRPTRPALDIDALPAVVDESSLSPFLHVCTSMNEFIQGGELKAQAKRLLHYRIPLALAITVNCFLVARIPMTEMRGDSQASQVGRHEEVALLSTPTRRGSLPEMPPLLQANTAIAAENDTATGPHTTIASAMTGGRAKLPDGQLAQDPLPGVDGADATDAAGRTRDSATGLEAYVHRILAAATASQDAADADPGFDYHADGESHLWQLLASWGQPSWSEYPAPHGPTAPMTAGDTATTHAPPSQPRTSPAPAPWDSASHDPDRTRMTITEPDGVIIRNPLENNGPVRFLVNGRMCDLHPGEAHQFPYAPTWVVEFHRGASFGNARRTLTRGAYEFLASSTGWELIPQRHPQPQIHTRG